MGALKQQKQILLVCGMMLLMGWFTVTTGRMLDTNEASLTTGTPREIPVLMYHHLLPQNEVYGMYADNNIVVTVETFQAQVAQLKELGYQTITLSELNGYLKGEKMIPEKSVVITFDDGYLSNYEYGLPILKEAGYTGVIFLLTGYVEETPQEFNPRALQYLSWPQIAQMRNTFEFACHTDHLHRLNQKGRSVLLGADATDILSDLNQSRQQLNNTVYYSYPYGHYNQTLEQLLQDQGIEMAFAVNPKSVKLGDDRLALSRWDMYQYSLEQVLGI